MNRFLDIIKIISVIIGTIIGAGFASGKEIYIFFAQYGINGLIGAIFSSALTAIIIYGTILIVKKSKVKSNNEFVEQISNGDISTAILKNIINIFLIVSFWVMCAGFCTFFKQELGIPIIITAIVDAIIIYVLLMKNVNGIIKLNLVVVPVMIAIIVFISIKNYPITNALNSNINICNKSLGKAIISAILYTSYNSITLIPIIISLESKIKDSKASKIITILSGCIIFVLILAIYQMLTLCSIEIKNIEIPVLAILDGCHSIEKIAYSIAIVTAILTSAISAGYGTLENIRNNKKYKNGINTMCITDSDFLYRIWKAG